MKALLIALLLISSPAFAKKPAAKKVCITPASIVGAAPGREWTTLEGDDLARFVANLDWQRPIDLAKLYVTGSTVIFYAFSKGCSVGFGDFPASTSLRMLGLEDII